MAQLANLFAACFGLGLLALTAPVTAYKGFGSLICESGIQKTVNHNFVVFACTNFQDPSGGCVDTRFGYTPWVDGWDSLIYMQASAYACPDGGYGAVCTCERDTTNCWVLEQCDYGNEALVTWVNVRDPGDSRRALDDGTAGAALNDTTGCVPDDECCDISGELMLMRARCGSTCEHFCD
eukprot:TRINITY_DN5459_c0_g1_i1.p1 TRINITY_DN5459_c0_g1~~TRINITY_DN5459_c0_g1_i1.p1  ORF type:complete len:207 (-),score=62.77 TRINITY_DN5459_c0_g1_i1:776-1315(-)